SRCLDVEMDEGLLIAGIQQTLGGKVVMHAILVLLDGDLDFGAGEGGKAASVTSGDDGEPAFALPGSHGLMPPGGRVVVPWTSGRCSTNGRTRHGRVANENAAV